MAKLKLTVHPLFFLFGIYFALTGKIFVFLTYTVVAVVHELGHSLAAARLGYKLNRIVLMPYGAVISGEAEGLRFADEIKIALAGPLTNLACAVLFAAVWWVYPEAYAYTDLAMTASLSIAAVNLIPCRPLDGGRVLHAFLCIYLKRSVADGVLKLTGLAFSCVLCGLFILSCFNTVNFSVLFFALFALFGTIFTGKNTGYVRIFQNAYGRLVQKGAEVKRVAVTERATVKKAVSLMREDCLTELAVYGVDGRLIEVIPPQRVCDIAGGGNLYAPLSDFLNGNKPV